MNKIISIVLLPLLFSMGCGSGNDTAPTVSGDERVVSANQNEPENSQGTGERNDSTQNSNREDNNDTTTPANTPDASVTAQQQWVPPEGCIGTIDTDGTYFCVYPESRSFVASNADGTEWWSFVLPGDNATNEIEAVFLYGDKVGLLADTVPGAQFQDAASSKFNPYEISLFERHGEFIYTVSLLQDMNEAKFPNDQVGHQVSDEKVSLVTTGNPASPHLMIGWNRKREANDASYTQFDGVVTRYDVATGLPLAQYEEENSGTTVKLNADPFFADTLILVTSKTASRLTAPDLQKSENTLAPASITAPGLTRISNREFELYWPEQFGSEVHAGDEVTFRVSTFVGYYAVLADQLTSNHFILSFDSHPFAGPGFNLGPVQITKLVNGEPSRDVLYARGSRVRNGGSSCEPLCDLFKVDAPGNLRIDQFNFSETSLNWEWENEGDVASALVYRDGTLIGVTENNTFVDKLRIPIESSTYTIIGLTPDHSQTLASSVYSPALTENSGDAVSNRELMTAAFIDSMLQLAVGNPLYADYRNTHECDRANRDLIFRSNNIHHDTWYMFDCKTDTGVSSGLQSNIKPIAYRGHYHSWFSTDYDYADFHFRGVRNDALGVLDNGTVSTGYGGGGVPDAECPGDSWKSLYTEAQSYEFESYSVLVDGYSEVMRNAEGRVYNRTSTIRVRSETEEVVDCVQRVSLGAQSYFTYENSKLDLDLDVALEVLFYKQNPPQELDERYTLTLIRKNGDVITISYPAIGSNEATVTYPENGSQVTVQINTAGAAFVDTLL